MQTTHSPKRRVGRPYSIKKSSPGILKRLWKNHDGASAIEIALVLPPLFLLLLGTVEYCIVFYVRGSIESVTHSTARYAITGSAYGAGMDRNAMLTQRLEETLDNIAVGGASMANGRIRVETEVFADLSSLGTGGTIGGYGSSGELVRYTIDYDYVFFTPLANLVSGETDNTLTLRSTVFVRNENF